MKTSIFWTTLYSKMVPNFWRYLWTSVKVKSKNKFHFTDFFDKNYSLLTPKLHHWGHTNVCTVSTRLWKKIYVRQSENLSLIMSDSKYVGSRIMTFPNIRLSLPLESLSIFCYGLPRKLYIPSAINTWINLAYCRVRIKKLI